VSLSKSVIEAAMEHARKEYPRESCGLVVGGEYVPRKNTAQNPEEDFRISPQGWVAAERKGGIEAVIHSHPNSPAHPSHHDMAGQINTGIAWGIVPMVQGVARHPFFWGGDTAIPDLEGREWRHGVTDCYSCARDWYRLTQGVTIPDYARSDEWWEGDDDLLKSNFRQAGFEAVAHGLEPGFNFTVGDGFLMQIGGDKLNHCGVYLGNGLMLHHLRNRLSRTEPVNRWRKFVRLVVRRVPA